MPNDVVTYEPDNSLRKGYPLVFRELLADIVENRWLTFQLFRRDFFSTYKQSLIGMTWMILSPLVNVAVFLVLSRSGVLHVGDIRVPYPLYAVLGMALWQVFSAGLGACTRSLSAAGEMVTRINFSKKSLVLATMGKPMVAFLIQMALVLSLFLAYGLRPHPGMLLLPFVLAPLVLLTLGLGFLVALLNAIVRDVGNLLPVLTTFLLYLTPVLYAPPQQGLLAQATAYNPVHHLIAAGRDLSLDGQIGNPAGLLAAALLSVCVFCLSLFAFHLAEPRIAERI